MPKSWAGQIKKYRWSTSTGHTVGRDGDLVKIYRSYSLAGYRLTLDLDIDTSPRLSWTERIALLLVYCFMIFQSALIIINTPLAHRMVMR